MIITSSTWRESQQSESDKGIFQTVPITNQIKDFFEDLRRVNGEQHYVLCGLDVDEYGTP